MGARSRKTHIALEYVEQLRQLVNGQCFDDSTDTGLPRIVFDLVERTLADALFLDQLIFQFKCFPVIWILRACTLVDFHVAELVYVEVSIVSHSFVFEDDRAARIQLDCERNEGEKGCGKEQCRPCEREPI